MAAFIQDELSSLIVTLAFLTSITILLITGVFVRDDVLVASLLTLIASYWFTSAAHRAGGAAVTGAAQRAVETLLTSPAPIPVRPVSPVTEPAAPVMPAEVSTSNPPPPSVPQAPPSA